MKELETTSCLLCAHCPAILVNGIVSLIIRSCLSKCFGLYNYFVGFKSHPWIPTSYLLVSELFYFFYPLFFL